MKVINSLIVVEVPRDVTDMHMQNWHLSYNAVGCFNQVVLPPGQYEIIGTLDDLCNGSSKKDEVIKAAQHPNNILTGLLLKHGIISTTSDIGKPEFQLLFIKRLA